MKEQMVGEFFFLDELFADIRFVLLKRWVVGVMDPSVRVFSWTLRNAGGRGAFGTDAVTKVDTNGKVAVGGGQVTQGVEGGKSTVPVAVGSCVLAAQPAVGSAV